MTESDIVFVVPFLGEWRLDPASCVFGQGEPPVSARQTISGRGPDLLFEIELVDADGARQVETFVSRPDGRPEVFPGGDLADAIATSAPAAGVLETIASYRGVDRMSVVRILSVDAATMTLIQTVTLPDGTELVNRSVYRRVH